MICLMKNPLLFQKKVKIHPDKTYVEVKGIIKNRGPQARYVKVSVPCYDKKGEKLGNTFELIEVLNSKESWEFKAKLWTNSDQKIKKCDLDQLEVDGFQ